MRKAIAVLLFFLAGSARAGGAPLSVTRVEGQITIDGDLTDSGWTNALKVEDFVEYYKSDNAPAPVPTFAWITYDDEAIYFALRADDPQPSAIRAPFVDRDKVLGDQDYFGVMLDTQNDRRSSTTFRVNARGVQYDSVFNDANQTEDLAPDFFFESSARITSTGWAAEIRVPLSSLRYANRDPQTWAILMSRNYPRDFRYVIANTAVPKGSNCFLCHFATLSGLSGLPGGAHMTFAPYSAAQRNERQVGNALANDPLRSDVGIDWKWSASPALTVDTTLNPDFSQIESDVPQLSVNNRFALSFPEKRTFFLEGVDLLSTPLRAVYTRSITSPAWGIRATGQTGSSAYTLLVAEDRGGGTIVLPSREGTSFAPQDFRSRVLIGRLRQSFGSSFGGLLLSSREYEGGGHNRVVGPDLMLKRGADKITAQALVSSTENPNRPDLSMRFKGDSLTGYAGRFIYQRDTSGYDIWTSYFNYSSGFRADNGFIPMVGAYGAYVEAGSHHYPKRFASYLRPFIGYGHETVWKGAMIGAYMEGKWGLNGWVAWHPGDVDVVDGRSLTRNYYEIHMRANPWRQMPSISVDGSVGERVDFAQGRVGNGASMTVATSLRPTDHLEVELNTNREWLDLEAGERLFSAQVNRLKTTYVFNSRSLVRLIAQHGDTRRAQSLYRATVDDRDGDLTLSALYGYRLNWQTTFFVGYGDLRSLDERDRMSYGSRSVFMKVSYALQR